MTDASWAAGAAHVAECAVDGQPPCAAAAPHTRLRQRGRPRGLCASGRGGCRPRRRRRRGRRGRRARRAPGAAQRGHAQARRRAAGAAAAEQAAPQGRAGLPCAGRLCARRARLPRHAFNVSSVDQAAGPADDPVWGAGVRLYYCLHTQRADDCLIGPLVQSTAAGAGASDGARGSAVAGIQAAHAAGPRAARAVTLARWAPIRLATVLHAADWLLMVPCCRGAAADGLRRVWLQTSRSCCHWQPVHAPHWPTHSRAAAADEGARGRTAW